ncbi:unnamed protein product [Alopecurus aequalis]
MAALLRQGARRIGGSVLQRTQAAVTSPAVAEERRRLVPRRMLSTEKELEANKKKEELYEVLSKVDKLRDRALLQDLAAHIEPRQYETEWRRLRVARKLSNFVEATGTAAFVAFVFAVTSMRGIYDKAVKQVTVERENQLKKEVAM